MDVRRRFSQFTNILAAGAPVIFTMDTVMSAPTIDFEEQEEALQFARQLYAECVAVHGLDHEYTRIVLDYIADIENR
jgi:hypothetical protein